MPATWKANFEQYKYRIGKVEDKKSPHIIKKVSTLKIEAKVCILLERLRLSYLQQFVYVFINFVKVKRCNCKNTLQEFFCARRYDKFH